MKPQTLLPLIGTLLALSCTPQEAVVVDQLPTEATSANYPTNRAPLAPAPLLKLPTGSIQPQGWIKTILDAQQDGLNGHLGEISAWLQKGDNAWLKEGGAWGWEEVPYWLRGYSDLAFITGDTAMLRESRFWIDAILASQHENGDFGPSVYSGAGVRDLWPNMIVLWIMQNYYEYAGDQRVIDFMTRYCHYLNTLPDEQFLEDYWEKSRGGDNLWSVVWLYNRTGDTTLLSLGEKLHRNTDVWYNPTSLPNWHNVNIAQGVREPATWYLFSRDSAMLRATYNAQELIRRTFGQVPGGMFGADENARMGYIDPRQGTETCGFAEQMATDQIMMLISGDPYWAANCEDIAFNSMPAAMMPDMRSLRYLTCPNHVVSDSKNHSPSLQNQGPFLAMNPFSSRCCQHNHGLAWTYYNDFLGMATLDGGLCLMLYNSADIRARVADGQEILLTERTHYPFDETIGLTVQTDQAVTFPLYLRLPEWCDAPEAEVNGRSVGHIRKGNFLKIERTWKDGDSVTLRLPMTISKRYWAVNQNSVSVDYGPLTLSLEIGERYDTTDSRATAIWDSQWQEGVDASQWKSYEIHPTTPWNYALVDEAPITVVRSEWKEGANPFTLENVPLRFEATGRLIPSWGLDETGTCQVLPSPEAPRAEQRDPITLVPMGAARLRISAFPQAD